MMDELNGNELSTDLKDMERINKLEKESLKKY
jgi:hypothetical protein